LLAWIELDRAAVPGGEGVLRLKQRGGEFSIMLGANELMNSRLSGSEEALARLACERLASAARPVLLIGGLGMGFTLRAALASLPANTAVTVAELVPAVVAWARGPLAPLFAGSLDDPRVSVIEDDVGRPIRGAQSRYDAILLDVDNGPEGLSRPGNDALYSAAGLAAARRALRPGGIFGVWSSAPDPRFTARLSASGLAVEEHRVRAGRGRGSRHTIWLARRPA